MTETTSPLAIRPVHEVTDDEKFASLVAAMTENGWQGAEVVVHGDQALTGSHRIAAAERAGIQVPVVHVEDLLEDAGTSWADLEEEYGDDWYEIAVRLSHHLPASVVEHYGLDMH